MKIYHHNTNFDFGKHNCKSISEIVKIDPDYINWCIKTVDSFVLDFEDIRILNGMNSFFKLSDIEEKILFYKYDIYLKELVKASINNNMSDYNFDFIHLEYLPKSDSLGKSASLANDYFFCRLKKIDNSYFDDEYSSNDSEDRNYFNERFYDDNLDPDQQSMEYWDQF